MEKEMGNFLDYDKNKLTYLHKNNTYLNWGHRHWGNNDLNR